MAASACRSKLMNQVSLAFTKSALKSTKKIKAPSLSARSAPAARRYSSFFGLPAVGCAQSLLPLHSAVAVARLTSCLTSNSRSCRALSQDGNDGT